MPADAVRSSPTEGCRGWTEPPQYIGGEARRRVNTRQWHSDADGAGAGALHLRFSSPNPRMIPSRPMRVGCRLCARLRPLDTWLDATPCSKAIPRACCSPMEPWARGTGRRSGRSPRGRIEEYAATASAGDVVPTSQEGDRKEEEEEEDAISKRLVVALSLSLHYVCAYIYIISSTKTSPWLRKGTEIIWSFCARSSCCAYSIDPLGICPLPDFDPVENINKGWGKKGYVMNMPWIT